MAKFIARWDGKLVGTRKSNRIYTHAVVVQDDEAVARKHAYEYQTSKTDRRNFDWYTQQSRRAPGSPNEIYGVITAEEIADYTNKIEGGWDAYAERLRQKEINCFERAKKNGQFEPRVAGWSMSARNAEKMRSQHCGSFYGRATHFLGVVPAEVI